MNKKFEELSKTELVIIYNEWLEFKKRKEEQSLRNKRQREVWKAAREYAMENGFNPEEV